MLINRAYVTGRAGCARILAAVAAAALIAGCGSGGGTPAPSSGAPATPTPVVSGAGIGEGSAGSGNATAAGSVSSAPTGTLSRGRTGSLARSSTKTTFSVSHTQVTGSVQSTQLMTPAQAEQAQHQASAPVQSHTTTTPASHHTVTTPPSNSNSSAGSTPPAQPTVPTTKVLVIHRTKVVTLTRTRTRTITRTITKTVPPKVPAGAYMPSTKPELAQHVFTITGANIGCVLSTSGVRCGVGHKSWTAPAQPKSCKSTNWGSTLALTTRGLPAFACGGSDPVNKFAKVIPSGWDTTVGDYTCQVRSFAVDCFNSKSNSGFTISRTGYSIY